MPLYARHLSRLLSVVCHYVDTSRCMRTSYTSDCSLYEVPFKRLDTSLANFLLSFFADGVVGPSPFHSITLL